MRGLEKHHVNCSVQGSWGVGKDCVLSLIPASLTLTFKISFILPYMYHMNNMHSANRMTVILPVFWLSYDHHFSLSTSKSLHFFMNMKLDYFDKRYFWAAIHKIIGGNWRAVAFASTWTWVLQQGQKKKMPVWISDHTPCPLTLLWLLSQSNSKVVHLQSWHGFDWDGIRIYICYGIL